MKQIRLVALMTAGMAVLVASGCGKQETAASAPTVEPAQKAASTPPKNTQTDRQAAAMPAPPTAPTPPAAAPSPAPTVSPASAPAPAAPSSAAVANETNVFITEAAAKIIASATNPPTPPEIPKPATITNALPSATNAVNEAAKAVEPPKPPTLPPAVEATPAAALAPTQLSATNIAGLVTNILVRVNQGQKSLSPETATAISNQVQAAAAGVTNQFLTLLEKAKGLLANQKYQDTLTLVGQIYTNKLTPEQRQLVDGLKTQAQAALTKQTATNAASLIGDFLRKK